MTTPSLDDPRCRLYKAYATEHAGCGGGEAAALVYRRDTRPLLPPPAAGPVVELTFAARKGAVTVKLAES